MHETELFMSETELKKYRVKKTLFTILVYAFLIAVALFILIPFYWMVATALRSTNELAETRISFFPKEWLWENFLGAIVYAADRGSNFLRIYLNTILVGLLTTIGTLFTTVFASFAFARLNFKFKNGLFSLLLATMMIPGEIFIISNYTTVIQFGMINTYWALVLPFATSVFYIFFLRQTFMQIPNELYLAAKVDGTGDFKYLFRVMIPMAKSTITTITILSMMGAWNAFIWPNLVAKKPTMYLVSNGLLTIFKATDDTSTIINFQMAAATLVTVPLIIVFIILRKYIMRGVSRSGIKG
ncbi:MAG: carbohydrate ABC transporter permease [Bacilli bacterium]|nr:carbohydrate ABC transporter permease [Bacilli bacterium]